MAFFCTLSLLAQEPFFCTRPGTKLYYERYKAGTTKLTQTTLFEIESNKAAASGREIHYAVTMAKANGKYDKNMRLQESEVLIRVEEATSSDSRP